MENLAREGLRTLVICFKVLDQQYFLKWQQEYQQAHMAMENRESLKEICIKELENELELLCVSGVEDKL